MKLYHYSNKKINTVKIDKFASNIFTLNDKKASSLNRSFFYYDISTIENRFKHSILHYTDISNSDIYNLNEDIAGYKSTCSNIDILLNTIKKYGYKGILYDIGNLKIVNLFYDIQVKEA